MASVQLDYVLPRFVSCDLAKVKQISNPPTHLHYRQHCKEVLGVEIVAEAIEDATFNATENGVTNAKFYAGNCDDFIHKFVFEASGNDILAIVDPPRAGLSEFADMQTCVVFKF